MISTSGDAEKVEVCRALGAEVAVDYREESFADAVKEATGGRGAGVTFDPVGSDVFDLSRKYVAFEGRIVVGFAGRIADVLTNHALVEHYSVFRLHSGLYDTGMSESVAKTQEVLSALCTQDTPFHLE